MPFTRSLDQVWATHITYFPLQKDFLYLARSLTVLQERAQLHTVLSIEEGRQTGIIHSDQGSQFTPSAFLARLQIARIMIRSAGRNRFYGNTLVKRLRLTDK